MMVVALQVHQRGAQVGVLVGQHPDQAGQGADRRVARLAVVDGQSVAGHHPQPRRFAVPAGEDRANRRRDAPRQVATAARRVTGLGAVERLPARENDDADRRQFRVSGGLRERFQDSRFSGQVGGEHPSGRLSRMRR